ncbi:MAG: nuclear transport factor 2 family protein [Acidobacteriota bacterium]|nr:nuclear transport factor 2 family protein [Acidobacteriota bacterium]
MRKLALAASLISAFAGVSVAQEKPAPAAKAPSVSAAIKQLEHDWTDATKAGDTDKLGQIIADDWAAVGPDGAKMTKQSYLESYKSGKSKLESFEFGAMDVKVLGNTAVVQGSDTEKSMGDGKDTSGKYVWTDVFVKRDGKWVAVRSQLAKVK